MMLKHYLSALLFGIGIFLVQLLLVAEPQLSMLSPKSAALAGQAFFSSASSPAMLLTLCGYALIGLTTHAAPMLFTAKVYRDLKAGGSEHWRRLLVKRGAFGLSLLGTLMLLVMANNAFFPVSLTFPGSDLLMIQTASPLLVLGLPLLYAAAVAYWLVRVASTRAKALSIALLLAGVVAWAAPDGRSDSALPPGSPPNLIVIGIDSLRPDHIAINDPVDGPTPAINAFVSDSIHFEQAYTTQARTFVAYMSILSGQYPVRHQVRENLYPVEMFDKDVSVAHRLKENGYTTVFAMDEARFANIDENFGFDTVVTPPPGTVDFLVGALLDTVGTNLLQLVPYAHRILPHIAGNRAATSVYVPRLHSSNLGRAIAAADSTKPLFLVSHFCMAHVPYAPRAATEPAPADSIPDSPNSYRAALRIADGQVQELLSNLRARGRLDNAILVLLSDHGEALGMLKDRWNLATPGQPSREIAYHGHGSSALDAAQSRVLLSIQRFENGNPVWQPRSVRQPASLVDIAPTLLTTANLTYAAGDFDGLALLQPNGTSSTLAARALFIESGITGSSLQKVNVEAAEVANEFNYLYRITPEQRFELLPEELPEQLRRKQRAMVLGDYGLSSWPPPNGAEEGCWLKLDLRTRRAHCLPLDTKDAIVSEYKPFICRHFAGDTDFSSKWCPLAAGAAPAPPPVHPHSDKPGIASVRGGARLR